MLSISQTLLTDLLSSNREIDQTRIDGITEFEWSEFSRIAREHRLEPLIHNRIASVSFSLHIPVEQSSVWAEAYRSAAIKSLQAKWLLMNVVSILGEAGIPFLALKGAWLTWDVYPDPALRPLRDIDILVSKDDAVRTFKIFEENGFKQQLDLSTPLSFTIENYKHMPGLLCPKSGKRLEVHVRLVGGAVGKYCPAEMADFETIYRDRVASSDLTPGIAFPSITLSLLHVIIHAVNDHMFNNGPLFIEDVRQILASQKIDWPQFWDLAAQGGWTKACELSFDLVELIHGEQKIDWQNSKRGLTPKDVIDAALELSLQRLDAKSNILQAAKAPTAGVRSVRVFAVLRWIFLRHFTLANVKKLSTTSLSAYLNYPGWVVRNLRRYNWRNEKQIDDEIAVSTVITWLGRKAD